METQTQPQAIYDCFTVFTELDLIEARLAYLYPHVEKFVLVESTKCHTGETKPLIVEENKERFAPYWDKVIHIKDTEAPDRGPNGWAIENHHRNCIVKGLKDAKPTDIILISDLDEIPSLQVFPFLRSPRFKVGETYSFVMMHYNYFVNIYSPLNPCVGTVAVHKQTLDIVNPQHMRNIKDHIPRLLHAGWHVSYLGGIDRLYNKFMTSCDVADRREIPSKEELWKILKKRLKEGQFNLRHDVDHFVTYVPNPSLPSSITKEKYPQFFLEDLDKL